MSIILAKFLGIYFSLVGLSLFINPLHFKDIYKKFVENDLFQLLGGIIALLLGAAIVSIHNVWIFAWPVFITILGYYSLIKGFCLITYPDVFKSVAKKLDQPSSIYRIISLIWLFLGLFFLYKGFYTFI